MWISAHRCIDHAGRQADPSVDHGQVAPGDRPRHQLRRERFVGLTRLGEDEDPRRVLVEAVHDAGPARSPDAGDRRRVSESRRGQCPGGIAGTGMHDHTGRLVDDEDLLVFEEDGERDRLRQQIVGRGRQDVDLDRLAAVQPMRRLRRGAVDGDVLAGDQVLDARARQVG